jgi:hypothetical protein
MMFSPSALLALNGISLGLSDGREYGTGYFMLTPFTQNTERQLARFHQIRRSSNQESVCEFLIAIRV